MSDNYNNESDSIIILNDEDGNEVEMEYIDLVEYEGKEYIVLLPVEEDADEVVILLIESYDEETDTEVYAPVEDDETLGAVYQIFKEKYKDIINFAD
ncbi:MAG: DUF1292 domain-containing protein [Ruminococcus sp.]|nr:DUF1292 domain-containing protein [Ruminococcus sp.]